MKRTTSAILTAALIVILAACNGTTGGLGSVPSAVPTPSPDASGTDLTPAPSASTSPSSGPSIEPSDAPGASATPAGTTAEPGSRRQASRIWFNQAWISPNSVQRWNGQSFAMQIGTSSRLANTTSA